MTKKERITLDRRHALTPKNLLFSSEVGCRDALKRRKALNSKVLKTKPAILGKIEFVPKKEL